MKILIIARNSFPKQGPRAFRTAELSEQLAKMGHDVTVYSVKGQYDYSEYERVTGVKMKGIKTIFAVEANDGPGGKKYLLFRRFMSHFFHFKLYFPEIEFYYRVRDALKQEKDVDLLISIAQPHTIHWGVYRALKKNKKSFPKVWIADCGDPLYFNPFDPWPFYIQYIEKKWCREVDAITVPTEGSKDGYFPEFRPKIDVIPQGFDFSKTPISEYKANQIPTFLFAGTIHNGRSPESFMDYLLSLDIDYKFYLYLHTPLDRKYEELSKGKIQYMLGYSRKDIIEASSKMDFLINVKNINTVQTPSKLIDYGISQRPVLEVSNVFCEGNQFQEFIQGDYKSKMVMPDINAYRIENVASKFIDLYQRIINNKK